MTTGAVGPGSVRISLGVGSALNVRLRALWARIGVPRALLEHGVDPEVLSANQAALQVFAGLGAAVIDIDLPHAQYAIPVYYLVATAEASSNLARYDGVRYGYRAAAPGSGRYDLREMYAKTREHGFGAEVKRRIMLGTYVLSAGYYDAYYLKAQQARSIIKKELKSLFQKYDVLAGPTMPVLPFKIGEKIDDPLKMYLVDVDTVVANLAGVPAISVPAGFAAGLPVGLQLMADGFCEQTLFDASGTFEQAAGVRGSPDL